MKTGLFLSRDDGLYNRPCGPKVTLYLRREFMVTLKRLLGCACIFSAGHLHVQG